MSESSDVELNREIVENNSDNNSEEESNEEESNEESNGEESNEEEDELTKKINDRLKQIKIDNEKEYERVRKYYEEEEIYNDDEDLVDKISKINKSNTCSKKQRVQLLENIMTERGLQEIFLNYELLNYRIDDKIKITKTNHMKIAEDIKSDLRRFSLLIAKFLEDKEWCINYEGTLNFSWNIPHKTDGNSIVFSNTIQEKYIDNDILRTAIINIKEYIKNKYKTKSISAKIMKDNKYKIGWILITIKYIIPRKRNKKN